MVSIQHDVVAFITPCLQFSVVSEILGNKPNTLFHTLLILHRLFKMYMIIDLMLMAAPFKRIIEYRQRHVIYKGRGWGEHPGPGPRDGYKKLNPNSQTGYFGSI